MPRSRKSTPRSSNGAQDEDHGFRQTYFTPQACNISSKRAAAAAIRKRQQTLTQIDFLVRPNAFAEDMNLDYELPQVQSAPPRKKRRLSNFNDSSPSTRPRPKRRSLRLQKLPPDGVDLNTVEPQPKPKLSTNDITKPPEILMPPPPVTPRKNTERVVPSSQSPEPTPLSLRSQFLPASRSQSPLKELSANTKRLRRSPRRGVNFEGEALSQRVEDTFNEKENSQISTQDSLSRTSSRKRRDISTHSDADSSVRSIQSKSRSSAPKRVLEDEHETAADFDIPKSDDEGDNVETRMRRRRNGMRGADLSARSKTPTKVRSFGHNITGNPTTGAVEENIQQPLPNAILGHGGSLNVEIDEADVVPEQAEKDPSASVVQAKGPRRSQRGLEKGERLSGREKQHEKIGSSFHKHQQSALERDVLASNDENEFPDADTFRTPKHSKRTYARKLRRKEQRQKIKTEYAPPPMGEASTRVTNEVLSPLLDTEDTGNTSTNNSRVIPDVASKSLELPVLSVKHESDSQRAAAQLETEYKQQTQAFPVMETESQYQNAWRPYSPQPPLPKSDIDLDAGVAAESEGTPIKTEVVLVKSSPPRKIAVSTRKTNSQLHIDNSAAVPTSSSQAPHSGPVPPSQATTVSILSSPLIRRGKGKSKVTPTQALLSSQEDEGEDEDSATPTQIKAPKNDMSKGKDRVLVPSSPVRKRAKKPTPATIPAASIAKDDDPQDEEESQRVGILTMIRNKLGFVKPMTDSEMLPESLMNFELPKFGASQESLRTDDGEL